MKSLNEVVEIVGLKRRAIQEYEKAGLAIKPTAKSKYGHLLYDTPEIERLWQLKFYKECGYKIDEIKELQKNGKLEDREELNRIIAELKEKQKTLDNLIVIAEVIAESGLDFDTLRSSIITSDEIYPNNVLELMSATLKVGKIIDPNVWFKKLSLSDNEIEGIFDLIDTILKLKCGGDGPNSVAVQKAVASIHKILSREISGSVAFFRMILYPLAADKEIIEVVEEEYGTEETEFIISAIKVYCDQNKDNPIDTDYNNTLVNIEELARSKHKYSCEEVQLEVKNLHKFLSNVNVITSEGCLEWLKYIGEMYDDQAYKDLIDNGSQRGISWFISKAIEFYLNNLENNKEE